MGKKAVIRTPSGKRQRPPNHGGLGFPATKRRRCRQQRGRRCRNRPRQKCPPPGERPFLGLLSFGRAKESEAGSGAQRPRFCLCRQSGPAPRRNRRVASRQTPSFLSKPTKRKQKMAFQFLPRRLAAPTTDFTRQPIFGFAHAENKRPRANTFARAQLIRRCFNGFIG